jgi:hypothetical protein
MVMTTSRPRRHRRGYLLLDERQHVIHAPP